MSQLYRCAFLRGCLFSFFAFFFAGCGQNQKSIKIPELPTDFENQSSRRLAYLNEQLRRDGDNHTFLYQRARLYLKAGNIPEAIEDIRDALRLKPGELDYLLVLGDGYFKSKAFRAALETYKEAEQNGYSEPDLYLKMGECQVELGQFAVGLVYLEKGKKYFPNNPQLLYYSAIARLFTKDTIRAISDLSETVRADSGYGLAYQKLLQIYKEKQDWENAFKISKAATIKSSQTATAYTDRAVLFFSQGYTDSAIVCYGMAIKIDSNLFPVLFELGKLYLVQKRNPEAEQAFKKLVLKSYQTYISDYYLGVSLYFQGKNEEAIHYFSLIPESNEKYEKARSFLEKLRYLTPEPNTDSFLQEIKPDSVSHFRQ